MADAAIEGKHIYDQKIASGEIVKPKEDESTVVVERKVFVFKEFGEEKEGETKSESIAVSESEAGEAAAAAAEETKEESKDG